jgi:Cd2+/Zn2+-exporting ATPase
MALIPNLMAAGFTEYEAKVYLALLRDSPATGYQISKNAGVPRSMVYEALGRLQGRGAVLRSEAGRTSLYRPVPPDVLVERYRSEHERLIHDLQVGLNTIFKAQTEDHLWSIKGRGSVISYAIQLLEDAVHEVLLVLSDEDLALLTPAVAAAHRRGVAVSALLTGDGELPVGQAAQHPPLESQLQGLDNMLVVVVDGKQALIANSDPEKTATITSNRNLVLIARQFVWMELFAQRIYARLGTDLLDRLDAEDRRILEVYERPGQPEAAKSIEQKPGG